MGTSIFCLSYHYSTLVQGPKAFIYLEVALDRPYSAPPSQGFYQKKKKSWNLFHNSI